MRINDFKKFNEGKKASVKKIADYLFGSLLAGIEYGKLSKEDQKAYDEAPWQQDLEKVEDYFNSKDFEEWEEFADEMKLTRKVSIEDLMDFSISEWPAAPQDKAIEYLLKHKLIDENGKWIGKLKESHTPNKVDGLKSVDQWYEMFTKINSENTESYVSMQDVEYYSDQIWNLTNEGDLSLEKCEEIANELAEKDMLQKAEAHTITKADYDKILKHWEETQPEEEDLSGIEGMTIKDAAHKIGPKQFEKETMLHLLMAVFPEEKWHY